MRTPCSTLATVLLLASCLWSVAWAQAADFTLQSLQGEEVRLSDYRGRWVVVNFWASWCAPCVRELPELARFQDRNPDVQVIGINYETIPREEARRFLQPLDINFPNLRITETPLVPFEPLEGLPTTAIVGPGGEIVERHLGPVTAKHLEAIVDRRREQAGQPR